MTRQMIDRYEIKKELGRGGMATVYLANDPRFRRDVAVKVLAQYLAEDMTFRDQFEHEAQIIANLEHRAIVPVYDYGETEGQLFLVMRLMPGGSLLERLRRGQLTLTETSRILTRLASALDKAHSQGIIHRDIKPANVMFDEDQQPYLSDFGIARLVEKTQTHSSMGTPQYMVPEQWAGQKLDARTDVYQLTIMLFQLLAGQVPFVADTTASLINKHLTGPIPSICSLRPNLPAACDDIMRKGMAKNQEDRYETVGELAAAFARIAQSEARTVPARPPHKPLLTFGKRPRLIRILFPGIALLLFFFCALSVLLTGALLMRPAPPTIARRAATAVPTIVQVALSNTAEPTLTHTPFPTLTPEPTLTPTPTASETPTPSPTVTPIPTDPATTTPSGEIDMSRTVLTATDLPSGFEAMPLALMGLNEEQLTAGGFARDGAFIFMNSTDFEMILGLLSHLPTTLEQARYDAIVDTPDFLVASMVQGMGDNVTGVTVVADSAGLPMQFDVVVFRRSIVGAMIMVMFPDGDQPPITAIEIGQLLDARIQENLAVSGPVTQVQFSRHSDRQTQRLKPHGATATVSGLCLLSLVAPHPNDTIRQPLVTRSWPKRQTGQGFTGLNENCRNS